MWIWTRSAEAATLRNPSPILRNPGAVYTFIRAGWRNGVPAPSGGVCMSILSPRPSLKGRAFAVTALLAGSAFAATALAPSPARAWWRGGFFIGLPPVVVAPGPVAYPPYYYPPAYYPAYYPPAAYYPPGPRSFPGPGECQGRVWVDVFRGRLSMRRASLYADRSRLHLPRLGRAILRHSPISAGKQRQKSTGGLGGMAHSPQLFSG